VRDLMRWCPEGWTDGVLSIVYVTARLRSYPVDERYKLAAVTQTAKMTSTRHTAALAAAEAECQHMSARPLWHDDPPQHRPPGPLVRSEADKALLGSTRRDHAQHIEAHCL
jgi:hypothetical protein